MTAQELTPEAIALLKGLINNPHPMEDSSMLQLLMSDRLVMGSPSKVHITQSGVRLIVEFEATKEWN